MFCTEGFSHGTVGGCVFHIGYDNSLSRSATTRRRAAQAMLERGGEQALEPRDVERALEDMLGAGGRLGARMLGAENAIGFAAVA